MNIYQLLQENSDAVFIMNGAPVDATAKEVESAGYDFYVIAKNKVYASDDEEMVLLGTWAFVPESE